MKLYLLLISLLLFTFCFSQAPGNDDAWNAFTLTIGAPCNGPTYTNENATLSLGEKYVSCTFTSVKKPVWFKFVASTAAVKITTDLPDTGPFTTDDTQVALYAASNVNDYNTFSIIACDDENGNVYQSLRSTIYATGLVTNQTYYIVVDSYSPIGGTFCITVDNLTSSMLSTTNTCASGYQKPLVRDIYTGQIPFVDNSGNLVAIVEEAAGTSGYFYSGAQNIYTGPTVRQDALGNYYLDRNFKLTNTHAVNLTVQLFFLDTELARLTAADPSITLSTMGITRQTGDICNNDLGIGGVSSPLTVTATGSQNGVSWVKFFTPAFSNFLVNKVGIVVPITIEYLHGTKLNTGNRLDWKVNCTNSSSVTMDIERSANGWDFIVLKNMNETDTRCLQPFSFTDDHPLQGINYYRINTIDVNGKIKYSSIIKILNETKKFEITGISPVPAYTDVTITLFSIAKFHSEIILSSAEGKIIQKQIINLYPGINHISLKTAALATGLYNISVKAENGDKQSIRFVKE